jgi:PAS domain S-box-containing protein
MPSGDPPEDVSETGVEPPDQVEASIATTLTELPAMARHLLAAVPGGLAVRGEHGEWVLANGAFAERFDADTPDALLGEPWTSLYRQPARERLNEEAFPTVEATSAWQGTVTGRTVQGKGIEHEVTLSWLPDGQIAWTVHETSSEHEPRSETNGVDPFALPEEAAIEPAPSDGLGESDQAAARFTVDADTRDLAFSNGLYGLLGLDPAREASIQTYLAIVHPEDEERVREHLEAAVEHGEGFELHHRLVDEAGPEPRTRHVEVAALAQGSTHPPGVIGTVADVTGLRASVERRAGADERLRLLLEHLPMAVYEFDRDDEDGPRPRFVGSQAREVLGYAPETLEDDPSIFLDRIHPDDHADRSRALERLASANGPVEVRYRFDHGQGESENWVWLSEAIVPRLDEHGDRTGFVSLLRDVTDPQSRLHELERYADEVVEANEQLDRFAYIAAHELKEPLRNIAGFAQLLDERYGDAVDTQGQEFLDYVLDATKRMRDQVDDILAYTRVDTEGIDRERVQMGEALNLALENLEELIDEHDAQVSAFELPEVYVHKYQLVQVLQNLIHNGIRFNENEAPLVHLAVDERDDSWLVRVTDNGVGIPPEHHERVFGIFEKLQRDEEAAGTGLGLAISRRIVERHGGEIWIEGGEGGGTTVKFTLEKERV